VRLQVWYRPFTPFQFSNPHISDIESFEHSDQYAAGTLHNKIQSYAVQ
jgi:hypothetical protein